MGWPARSQRRHPVSGVLYALLRERARATRLETGASLDAIAAELGVTTAAVSKWVSDLPEHAAIVEANHQARAERRRLYPVGTRPYVTKLIRAGIAPAERIRLAQETAR